MYTDIKLVKTFVLATDDDPLATNQSIIYPNPIVEGKFALLGNEIQAVELVSQMGQIYHFQLSESNEIDVSGLPCGIYVAKIKKKNAVEFAKILVK